MIRAESPRDQVNVAKVYEAGQEQIFQHWDDLSADERRSLLDQIDVIDYPELTRLIRTLVLEHEESGADALSDLRPVDLIPLDGPVEADFLDAVTVGEEALRLGQVAVFTVAGGQGTRLRFDGPKGLFPIAPVSGKSLFQLHAEKILTTQRRYKVSVPWVIMTSDTNDAATREFFQENGHFGLNAADIIFERQGMLPVVDDRRGKILLRSPSEIILSPNGHGGAVEVIQRLTELFEKRGVRYLSYMQVDNPMIHVCDPAFIGYHIVRESQFSSKAVPKASPEEKVGVFCHAGDVATVVEYSELGEREKNARDADGRLTFRAGNLANHVVSVDFLCPADGEAAFEMPYHVAHKSTDHLRGGELVPSEKPNSIKFESFLFDAMRYARNPIVLETSRREFAPVKNFEGADSPAEARQLMMQEWCRWLDEAGYEVPRDENGDPTTDIEISALLADGPSMLRERLNGRTIDFSESLLLQ